VRANTSRGGPVRSSAPIRRRAMGSP
jgi:hypothetical protein